MEIPTIELKLPKTGYAIVIRQYLTIGQSRDLQKILLAEGSFNTETNKFENFSTKTFLTMQDKAAEYLVKEYKDEKGIIQPFSQEWLSNLPVDDGSLIYEKINELTNASTLTKEAKKKL